jgi:hypothetical protein
MIHNIPYSENSPAEMIQFDRTLCRPGRVALMVCRPQRHATVTWRFNSQAMRVGTHPPADRDAGSALQGERKLAAIEAGRFDQLLQCAPSPSAAAPNQP